MYWVCKKERTGKNNFATAAKSNFSAKAVLFPHSATHNWLNILPNRRTGRKKRRNQKQNSFLSVLRRLNYRLFSQKIGSTDTGTWFGLKVFQLVSMDTCFALLSFPSLCTSIQSIGQAGTDHLTALVILLHRRHGCEGKGHPLSVKAGTHFTLTPFATASLIFPFASICSQDRILTKLHSRGEKARSTLLTQSHSQMALLRLTVPLPRGNFVQTS